MVPRSLLLVSLPSARELELEDRQSRLQQELRERMAVEGKREAGELHTGRLGVSLLLRAL